MDPIMSEAASELDISQILGMIIALVAVIYTLATTVMDVFGKKKPKPRSKEQEELLQEMLGTIRHEKEEEELEEEEEFEEERHHLVQPVVLASPVPASIPAPVSQQRGWPRPEEKFMLHSPIEDMKQKTQIEERHYDPHIHTGDELISQDLKVWGTYVSPVHMTKPSKIRGFLKALPSKRSLIIATEIIQRPVGFRDSRHF